MRNLSKVTLSSAAAFVVEVFFIWLLTFGGVSLVPEVPSGAHFFFHFLAAFGILAPILALAIFALVSGGTMILGFISWISHRVGISAVRIWCVVGIVGGIVGFVMFFGGYFEIIGDILVSMWGMLIIVVTIFFFYVPAMFIKTALQGDGILPPEKRAEKRSPALAV